MDPKQIEQLDQIAKRLDNSGLEQYLKLSQRTGKILWLNFISGLARGLGFSLGTTVILAILYKIIAHLIKLNIPFLTQLLENLASLAQGK